MRAIGIVGSPRKGGNTDVLVEEVLKGASSGGASTEKVMLCDLKIGPCDACQACHRTGICRQEDDMGPLLDRLFASEVWVLGTPVYWWGPSAQFKAFVDRWYAPAQVPDLAALMRKRVALVSAFGDSDPSTARHVVGMMEDALSYLKADFAGRVLVSANEQGEVARNPEALADAFALGLRLSKGNGRATG